jgi:hypothetical protein
MLWAVRYKVEIVVFDRRVRLKPVLVKTRLSQGISIRAEPSFNPSRHAPLRMLCPVVYFELDDAAFSVRLL